MKIWNLNPLFPRQTKEASLVEDKGRLRLLVQGEPASALEALALQLAVFSGDSRERGLWATWRKQNRELFGNA